MSAEDARAQAIREALTKFLTSYPSAPGVPLSWVFKSKRFPHYFAIKQFTAANPEQFALINAKYISRNGQCVKTQMVACFTSEARPGASLECALCNVICSSMVNLQEHMQGKGHRAKEANVLTWCGTW